MERLSMTICYNMEESIESTIIADNTFPIPGLITSFSTSSLTFILWGISELVLLYLYLRLKYLFFYLCAFATSALTEVHNKCVCVCVFVYLLYMHVYVAGTVTYQCISVIVNLEDKHWTQPTAREHRQEIWRE